MHLDLSQRPRRIFYEEFGVDFSYFDRGACRLR